VRQLFYPYRTISVKPARSSGRSIVDWIGSGGVQRNDRSSNGRFVIVATTEFGRRGRLQRRLVFCLSIDSIFVVYVQRRADSFKRYSQQKTVLKNAIGGRRWFLKNNELKNTVSSYIVTYFVGNQPNHHKKRYFQKVLIRDRFKTV